MQSHTQTAIILKARISTAILPGIIFAVSKQSNCHTEGWGIADGIRRWLIR